MDLLFVFLLLVLFAGLGYTLYRLYHMRTVATLSLAAGQMAVAAFLVFSYEGGVYHEPFVVFASFIIGVSAPLTFLYMDVAALRKKIKDRFGLSLSRFLYHNDHDEYLKGVERGQYVDHIIRPRMPSLPVDDVMGEIRVERADTSKNIRKQLEAAAKKYDEGDFAGAGAAYQVIEKVFNRSPSLYLNIGNVDYDRHDFDAAAQNYRRGIECLGNKDFENDDMAEKTGMLNYNLGNACFVAKKYARAIEAYKIAADALPQNADALYNLSFCHAMDYAETGDAEKAVEAFAKLVEDVPENLHAWFNYGKCLLKMKSNDQAIECFKKVVSEDVMFYEGWYRLAIAYDESGMVAEAVRAYYASIQLKPDFIDAYNNLGVLLSTVDRHGEALRVLKSAIRIKPGDNELVFNIGMTQYQSGKYEEALGEFLTCSRLRPDDEAVLYMIALIYMHIDKPRESMAYLEKAVQKDPSLRERASNENIFQNFAGRDEYNRLFA
ncbi:MAG: tetratricopeptide repeat protein [Oscillospiraceae bacterium]|nr:tetratricopeptide repeat protein [Oscillospiraceae bacterium]